MLSAYDQSISIEQMLARLFYLGYVDSNFENRLF
jgi:hypothetical protein